MDYKDATALDILDAVEKQFLIGEENKPIVKRDERGRFVKGFVQGVKRGIRWMKGAYMEGVVQEKVGKDAIATTYAQACLVGAVRLTNPGSREPYRDGERATDTLRWTGGPPMRPGDWVGPPGGIQPQTPGEKALMLILDEVQSRGRYSSIPEFNDAPSTKFSDVLDVIRKAKERYWHTSD